MDIIQPLVFRTLETTFCGHNIYFFELPASPSSRMLPSLPFTEPVLGVGGGRGEYGRVSYFCNHRMLESEETSQAI